MTAPLVVSTECPTCGAPLDFSEGSNAVRCAHCQSALLATGRKQVLSYLVPPRVAAAAATAAVKFSCSASPTRATITRIGLHVVPYYRFRGEDLRWERQLLEREPIDFATLNDLGVDVDALLPPARHDEEPEAIVALRERRIEKNFLACTLPGFPLYSLGVRASVLKLQLLDRDALGASSTIVAADIDADAALTHGLRTDDRDKLLHRQVIGRLLSLVYFPFWVAVLESAGARRVTIVDGVTEALVVSDADPDILATLDRGETAPTRTVGFRPLACPNCGWALPLEPDDVIFPCGACARVWLLEGDRLEDVRYAVAASPNGTAAAAHRAAGADPTRRLSALRYLPLWIIEYADAPCSFVPAFRYRRLKVLHDLARNLTRANPDLQLASGDPPPLHGAYVDEVDARAVADFVRAGETAEGGELRAEISQTFRTARLIWLPFENDGYSLRERFSGTSLPANLLM
jgi:LSD1 subclass zinc finger protein